MFEFANTNLTSLCYMLPVKQLTCQYEHAHCVNVMRRQYSLQWLPPCIVCAIATPYVSPFSCHLLHEPTSIAWIEYNLCPTIYSYLQTPITWKWILIMIHIEVTNKVGDDVVINMFVKYMIYIHRSRFEVYKICFHNFGFWKVRVK